MKRKSPTRHKVKTHIRKSKRVQSFMRGKGKPNLQSKKRIIKKVKNRSQEPVINWSVKASERLIAAQPRDLMTRASIVWMSPDEFLSSVPAHGVPGSAINMLEWDFDSGSLKNLRKRIDEGKSMDILYLDYTRMFAGYPSHEGRHRAFLAKKMGIKEVPVMIVKAKQGVD